MNFTRLGISLIFFVGLHPALADTCEDFTKLIVQRAEGLRVRTLAESFPAQLRPGIAAFENDLPIATNSFMALHPDKEVLLRNELLNFEQRLKPTEFTKLKGRPFSEVLQKVENERSVTAQKIKEILSDLPEDTSQSFFQGSAERVNYKSKELRKTIEKFTEAKTTFEGTPEQLKVIQKYEAMARGLQGEVMASVRLSSIKGTGALGNFVKGGKEGIEKKLLADGLSPRDAHIRAAEIAGREVDIVYETAEGRTAIMETKNFESIVDIGTPYFESVMKQARAIRELKNEGIIENATRLQETFVKGITPAAAKMLENLGVEVRGILH